MENIFEADLHRLQIVLLEHFWAIRDYFVLVVGRTTWWAIWASLDHLFAISHGLWRIK